MCDVMCDDVMMCDVMSQATERGPQSHFCEMLQMMMDCLTGSANERDDLGRCMPALLDSLFKLDR